MTTSEKRKPQTTVIMLPSDAPQPPNRACRTPVTTIEAATNAMVHTSSTTKARHPEAMHSPTRTPRCLGDASTPHALSRAHSRA